MAIQCCASPQHVQIFSHEVSKFTHIGVTRGVRCTPEHIIITAGSQGALDLAARTLLSSGEAAWLENPDYFGARVRAWFQCLSMSKDSWWRSDESGVSRRAWSPPPPHTSSPQE
jgi:hypothetical protein